MKRAMLSAGQSAFLLAHHHLISPWMYTPEQIRAFDQRLRQARMRERVLAQLEQASH